MAALLRTSIIAVLLVVATISTYVWITHSRERELMEEIAAIKEEMAERIAARDAMIERLSRSRRIAHVNIVDQRTDETTEIIETDILFIELDDTGRELGRQEFTIPGNILFIDAWTVKFAPEMVAEGNPMQGRTLVLLRRLYSDRMAPREGFTIDTPGAVPTGYAASDVARYEQQIWEQFWQIATSLQTARALGVRVAQGEAVYKPVKEGQKYELIVDAAGGMSLSPLEG